MIRAASSIEKQAKAFCALIGADPLLVQGAGGNVSWKDGSVLWVKASGTWLAEAESKEIFVPVKLTQLQDALAKQDFSVKPEIASDSCLRPSIETLLHALMPHKVVVHLHPVEILAYLVRTNARQKIGDLVGDAVKWIFVDYFKPGADLARAVFEELINMPDADVVFLGNHGVVIGGSSVDEILKTLNTLLFILKVQISISSSATSASTRESDFNVRGYIPCVDQEISLLALKKSLINRLRHEWALYPDHVVFLGPKAAIVDNFSFTADLEEIVNSRPPYIFCLDDFVYESIEITAAQKVQLRCYYEVLIRQSENEKLSTLTNLQVSDILNWDAEKYRQI